jgi:hypothetical protein
MNSRSPIGEAIFRSGNVSRGRSSGAVRVFVFECPAAGNSIQISATPTPFRIAEVMRTSMVV